jgi:radical SAM superfamily enzyme YgiQ (UPF0313 family)
MKLLLINIYSTDTIARYLLSSYLLKAYLQKQFMDSEELTVHIFNFSCKTSIDIICNEILSYNPDFIGYSSYIWNIEHIINIIRKLKSCTKYVHILGGPEISLSRILPLSKESTGDYYITGEGEKKLTDLMSYLIGKEKNITLNVPDGIAYNKGDGIYYKEDKSFVKLEDVPSVYLTGVIEDYLYEKQQAFLETQRGCKFRCKYCVYHKQLPEVSYYPLQRILDELDYLIINKKISALRIFDAIFTTDLNRAKIIVRHLYKLKEKLSSLPFIYWEFEYNSIDEEFIELVSSLKVRGKINNCHEILSVNRNQIYTDILKDYTVINCTGIQSFCEDALKASGRQRINPKKFNEFMNIINKYNIVLKIDIILGLPCETFDTYFSGLELLLPYIKDTDHILNIHLLQILPGSELELLCNDYGIKYSIYAPHIIYATKSMEETELKRASILTAILFRIINSPLRKYFFKAKENEKVVDILEKILYALRCEFPGINLFNQRVDDNYWNNNIYRDIPSDWLKEFLACYK